MAKLLLSPSSIPIHLRFCSAPRPFLRIPCPKLSPLRRNLSFKTKTMSVLSESPNEKKKYSKVAAESTGSIPAAELLGVVELAAKAGAVVIKDYIFTCYLIHYFVGRNLHYKFDGEIDRTVRYIMLMLVINGLEHDLLDFMTSHLPRPALRREVIQKSVLEVRLLRQYNRNLLIPGNESTRRRSNLVLSNGGYDHPNRMIC